VGFVRLNVRPGDAQVFTDDTYRGTTDEFCGLPDFLKLAGGRRKITLVREGFKTESFVVHARPEKIIELDVTLKPVPQGKKLPEATYRLDLEKTGSLTLRVDPSDATVYIDDVFYGPASQFSDYEGAIVLRTGSHRLDVVRPGLATYTGVVKISGKLLKEVHVKLEKAETKP